MIYNIEYQNDMGHLTINDVFNTPSHIISFVMDQMLYFEISLSAFK
jgi:hypothetical protein